MNYEQKYKEALKRAKEINNEKCAQPFNVMTRVFPELKESDDERIRKQIISFLKEFEYDHYRSLDFSSWIAWLEKQDNNADKVKQQQAIEIPFGAKDSELQEATYYIPDGYHAEINGNEVVIKKGKQKPIDNVEPRFHEGDWVVSKLDGKARRISEVHCDEYNKYYIVEGNEYNIEEYDRLHHLWDITKDAKDGDVLCLGSVIAIFKKYIGQNGCICYCSFCDNGGFEIPIENGEDNVYGCTNTTPATKEQRDLLFTKMKEKGYEWNKDKKELIKL